jgi:hypothetical protein
MFRLLFSSRYRFRALIDPKSNPPTDLRGGTLADRIDFDTRRLRNAHLRKLRLGHVFVSAVGMVLKTVTERVRVGGDTLALPNAYARGFVTEGVGCTR